MVVISVGNCPSQLRGDLTKWLQEIDVGVYVGKVSSRVRERIWERICGNIKTGKAIMVYSTNNEQGYEILTHNTEWQPKDYDGLVMMFKPSKRESDAADLKKGFSKAAKYEIARHQKTTKEKEVKERTEYVIIDVETTGLDFDLDSIIEVGILKIVDGKIEQQYQSYVKTDSNISEKITELTGITKDIVEKFGKDERQVINEVRNIIGGATVVGYNVQFDINFINNSCKKNNIPLFIKREKDVLKIARRKLDLENYKLETVCKELKLETGEMHRAVNDCMLVYKVLNELNKTP